MNTLNEHISDFQEISKHTPGILRKQLLVQLTRAFFDEDLISKSDDATSSSLERFHGVLLFIDISGFTSLSQKLSVDDLQSHINEYFSIMLDIVEHYGGDVIKFAGDAIYVTWPTSFPSDMQQAVEIGSDNTGQFSNDYLLAMKDLSQAQHIFKNVVTKAISCALDINRYCNDYAVVIREGTVERPPNLLSLPLASSNRAGYSHEPLNTFLNVHAGIGMGLMAGIDVGASNRWEYILIGSPINEVAVAESEAKLGEVALCANVHGIIHGHGEICGCKCTDNGCFILSKPDSETELPADFNTSRSRRLTRQLHSVTTSHHSLAQVMTKLTNSCAPLFAETYQQYGQGLAGAIVKLLMNNLDASSIDHLHQQIMQEYASVDENQTIPITSFMQKSQLVSDELREYSYEKDVVVRSQFMKWLKKCLCDDLKRHVHETARDIPTMLEPNR